MAFAAYLIKQDDVRGVVPLGVLEQTDPLGESLICQEKRQPKCATLCCKTPRFFDCYTRLTKSLRRARGLAVVSSVAVFCTVLITRASPEGA